MWEEINTIYTKKRQTKNEGGEAKEGMGASITRKT